MHKQITKKMKGEVTRKQSASTLLSLQDTCYHVPRRQQIFILVKDLLPAAVGL